MTAYNVLITGASSGLGQALAMEYATPGAALCLVGRNNARLAAVADRCATRGAGVVPAAVDVTDAVAMRKAILDFDAGHPLDIAIANAGITGSRGTVEETRMILATNVDGLVNTLYPAMDAMMTRRRGHLVPISSLAAYRGLAGVPGYCASKAAVKALGESLRGRLKRNGVSVTVVLPGFIDTPMSGKIRGARLFEVESGTAAHRIRVAVEKNQAQLRFPGLLGFGASLMAVLPAALAERFAALFDYEVRDD